MDGGDAARPQLEGGAATPELEDVAGKMLRE
jgi:hypothetical protein